MGIFSGIASKVFGSANDREVRKYQPKVDEINALEEEFAALSDEQLKAKTTEFKEQLANGAKLEDLLVPAFATVREASKRTLGMRHFDVQLIGGMILHGGNISEMRTGEGKTLVATLPVYLNALSGEGAHVVTVNDYLAQRDANWMGQIYEFLGMTTGVIINGLEDNERQAAYGCDITYGTNNEFGFDYLRDNMKYDLESMVQRGHNFAIVDEVDSILIDEARTPLIISGPLEDRSDLYITIDEFIPNIADEDYELDEKQRTVTFTEDGNEKLEKLLSDAGLLKGDSLYDIDNVSIVHHINNALKAHKLFTKDKDYIVRNNDVVIIDEFTGRMMPGRRYGEGQHQALEAKERVPIQPENQTLASVTFQNYFRMYKKLSGMTGTAMTEAEEFGNIYGLNVIEVPTNLPVQRVDDNDEVYRTVEEKYQAIIMDIVSAQRRKQPILVGTTSIEKSEFLSGILSDKKQLAAIRDKVKGWVEGFNPKKQSEEIETFTSVVDDLDAAIKAGGIKHEVLNARHHEQEAQIIANAGVPGVVTIATNMAGRGTDIQLGGNLEMRIESEIASDAKEAEQEKKEEEIRNDIEQKKKEALEAGGLYVIATERHESRRIDNQLRGRSGRQGDPGRSKFFLSLQDDLMRIFGSDRMDSMLKKLGLEEGEAIVHPWINKALEKAQKKVEARNFDIRKNLLKFDDVMNDQRKVIFEQRIDMMKGENLSETIEDMRLDVIDDLVSKHVPEKAYAEQWDTAGLQEEVAQYLNVDLPIVDWAQEDGIDEEVLIERITDASNKQTEERQKEFGDEINTYVEKSVMLQTLDHLWREHLVNLDHLRSVVGFRGYGQRDPLQEYKSESFELFQNLLANLRLAVTNQINRVKLVSPEEQAAAELAQRQTDEGIPEVDAETIASWGNVPRNALCPCGSGRKFKHCHGRFV